MPATPATPRPPKPPPPPPAAPGAVARREWQWAFACSLIIIVVTCLPYWVVLQRTPAGYGWPGLLYNFDDQAVYLAWMRQAADGQFFLRNLFTHEPQAGIFVHLYFWVLGALAGLANLPLALMHHLGRVIGGFAVLLLVYRLAALFVANEGHRRLIFLTVALSGGLGWLLLDEAAPVLQRPVDTWQPEALTFLSLYTNGLFAASLALMLAVVVGLLLAEERRQARWAVAAGAAGLVLANIHTYDVITLAAVWAVYLLARAAVERRLPLPALGYALLAAAVALPGPLWMLYFFLHEDVFRARAAVETLSPPFTSYLTGYGLLWPLALGAIAAWLLAGRRGTGEARTPLARNTALLLLVWLVVGCLILYLPVSFQRKLAQGLHFPLAFWAGLGLALGVERLLATLATMGRPLRPLLVASSLAILGATNLVFVGRDLQRGAPPPQGPNLSSTGMHPVYWPEPVLRAMRWAGENLPRDAVIWAYPVNGALLPALSGRTVYAGHWGETPEFNARMAHAIAVARGRVPPEEFERLLREEGITHVFVGFEERRLPDVAPEPVPLFPSLREIHRDGVAVIYRVEPASR